MYKKLLTFMIVCSLFSLLAASCRKADYKPSVEVPVDDKTQLKLLYSGLGSTAQTITVTAGINSEVRAAQGTKLRFYPFSFKDKNGNIISSGTVQIKLIEAYGPGAGVANRSASLSGNQLLKNGGQIYITASKDGQEVFVNKYGVGFLSLNHSELPMGLYYGNVQADDSLTRWMRVGNMTGTAVQGTVLDTMSVYLIDSAGTGVDTANIYRNYNMFDSVGQFFWVGCNYPQDITTTLTNLSVIPQGTSFTPANTMVFVVYPDISAVVPVNNYNATTHTYTLAPGYEIPTDMRVHIIVLSYLNGNIYLSSQNNITLARDMEFMATMTPYTFTEVLNLLSLL